MDAVNELVAGVAYAYQWATTLGIAVCAALLAISLITYVYTR
jgi:hypothetical protein